MTTRIGSSSASYCLAIVYFIWITVSLFSSAAFVLTVFVVPYDLHFGNDVDVALLSKTSPGLGVRILMLSLLILALFAPLYCMFGARKFDEGRELGIARED